MDPQVKSILTSILLAATTSLASVAASHGIIGTGDESAFANWLVTISLGLISAGIAWYKARQLSQTSMIQSVNAADNGVKVVANTASAPPAVNAPLKGN